MSFSIPERPPETASRPRIVSAVAIYQLLKAIYLVLLFFAVGFQVDLPFLRIGPLSHDVANFVMLVIGIFAIALLVIAYGLWNLESWARHAMLVPLGGVGYGVGYFFWEGHIGQSVLFFKMFFPAMLFSGLILLDVVSLAALLYYPDIARTFNDKDLEIPGL
jgi:hypothetical protein